MRCFVYLDASSHEFWNIALSGSVLTIDSGLVGTSGKTQKKTFADESKARAEHDRLIGDKLKKGYRETTLDATPAPDPLRESLEAALVEDPDELANHMAYADYLTEHNDPLGDFVRTQLALEDETMPVDERKRLRQQERKLLKAHGKTWLGDLFPYLLDQQSLPKPSLDLPAVKYTFRRGWLDSIRVTNFSVNLCRAMACSPALRLLRELAMDLEAYEEVGKDYEPGDDLATDCYFPQLCPLMRCPYLGNVRTFILGKIPSKTEEAEADDEGISCNTMTVGSAELVALMPRIERLYSMTQDLDTERLFSLRTLTNLRELVVYHLDNYPLEVLANNPALTNLTHLRFHPHALDDEEPYLSLSGVKALVESPHLPALTHLQLRLTDMGDMGIEAIVESGILARLKVLDLQHGRVTDAGARRLADCPALKNLELLDLTHNALSREGIRTLRATGVKVIAKNQWSIAECGEDYEEYLMAGDIE